jgi:type I restriction enzyme S subunit
MKRKKKQSKTVEELLQEVLVPAEEQPYPVPENWVWVKLGSVTEVIGGGTPKTSVHEYYENGTIPWITPADLSGYNKIYISSGKKNITELGLKNSSARLLPKGTVLFSSRAPIGYVAIAESDLTTNQGFKNFVPGDIIQSEYLYWFLKYFGSHIESIASGSTFKEVSGAKCKTITFPLAPVPTQKQIVQRIKSFLNKIDQAKQLIEEVKASWETRRMAILDQAFRGQLGTNDPSQESVLAELDGISEKDLILEEEQPYPVPENWVWVRLYSISDLIVDGSHNPPPKQKHGIPMLSARNVLNGKLNLDTKRYISKNDFEKEYKRVPVQTNDILLTIVGTIGRTAIIPELTEPISFQRSVALIRSKLKPEFIYYYLQSPSYQKYLVQNAKGTAQKGVYLRKIKNSVISLPPLNEQKRIVQKVESLLNRLDQERELTDHLEKQLDTLKQSILDRAFRGELGTQDSTDEHALERLKRSLQSQIAD